MNDLISRQAAIDEIDEWIKAFLEIGHKESAADARLIQDGIIQLPSAQPQRMRGRWITMAFMTAECSACHVQLHGMECANFCPSCGSYNGGEE